MRVLITNIELWPPSGTVVFTRDLALELRRQGHTPIVFSSTRGGVVTELRDAGIEVTDRLGRIRVAPDVIHGHHHAPTVVALARWPGVPAIFVCHDHTSPYDRTPIDPGIRRYFGVSRLCVRRLEREGVPAGDAGLLLNFVDTERFRPRAPLPDRPRRALILSNYAKEDSHLPAVVEACRVAGLDLDVVGTGVGRVATRPEDLLGQYDIVFAKAKAAMEAMAVGTAVVLCDFGGVGPMVTSAGYDALRPLNFGFEALRDPLRPELLLCEIARYDAADAARVRDRLRADAGLVPAVEAMVAVYRQVIAAYPRGPRLRRSGRWQALRASLFLRGYWRWWSLSETGRQRIRRIPGARLAIRAANRLLRAARS